MHWNIHRRRSFLSAAGVPYSDAVGSFPAGSCSIRISDSTICRKCSPLEPIGVRHAGRDEQFFLHIVIIIRTCYVLDDRSKNDVAAVGITVFCPGFKLKGFIGEQREIILYIFNLFFAGSPEPFAEEIADPGGHLQ